MTGNQTAESEAQQEVNILCKEKNTCLSNVVNKYTKTATAE